MPEAMHLVSANSGAPPETRDDPPKRTLFDAAAARPMMENQPGGSTRCHRTTHI